MDFSVFFPDEMRLQIGILSSNTQAHAQAHRFCSMREGEVFDLKERNLRRLALGDEFLDLLLIDDKEALLDAKVAKELKKSLQKNRNLVVISDELPLQALQAVYEPLGFSDFSTFESEGLEFMLCKKWFTFQF